MTSIETDGRLPYRPMVVSCVGDVLRFVPWRAMPRVLKSDDQRLPRRWRVLFVLRRMHDN